VSSFAQQQRGWNAFGDVAMAAAPAERSVRTRRPSRTADERDRSLVAELERRGFVLSRRIARPDLPTIDHLVVAASGVWVVARQHVDCARVSVRPRFTGRPALRVGGRDRTALIDDLGRQVTAIRGTLFDSLDVPVHAALCLPGAEFPLMRTLSVDDHLVLRTTQLLDQLERKGPLKRTRCREVAALLDARLA
jgi:hypothetical protein